MKLVANIQLKPTREQADLLRATLERCNEACNFLSAKGFEADTTRQFDLHKLAYAETRERFDLGAQPTVRCIAKVANAYTTQKANGQQGQITFRKYSAQPYDDRIVGFKAFPIGQTSSRRVVREARVVLPQYTRIQLKADEVKF